MSDKQFTIQDFVKKFVVPQWFFLLATVVYLSGFICEFTFFDRFGIQESGDVFLKARYIHAGILFLLFPVSILIPLMLKISLKHAEIKEKREKRAQKAKDDAAQIAEKNLIQTSTSVDAPSKSESPFNFPFSTIVSFFNISAMFYFFIFTPRNFILGRGVWVMAFVILVSFAGPIFINYLMKRFVVPHRLNLDISNKTPRVRRSAFLLLEKGKTLPSLVRYFRAEILDAYEMVLKNFTLFARWFLLIVVIGGFDLYMYRGYLRPLRIIFWGRHLFPPTGGIYYLFFISMIPYVMWRSNFHSKKTDSERNKTQLKLVGVSLGLMFYFLAIIAFALRVYPYIPVARGGGYYDESPRVRITFRPVAGIPLGAATNDPAIKAMTSSNSYVVLEQTASSVYLADINDEVGGPESWAEMRQLPHVTEVRLDTVDTITYTQFTRTNYYKNPK